MKTVQIYNQTQNHLVTSNGWIADTFWTRFRGLMGKKDIPTDYCLVIQPCNQIHMFSMKFAIDVVYLDANNVVVAIDNGLKPWSVGKKKPLANKVLEFNTGYIKNKITMNDSLLLK